MLHPPFHPRISKRLNQSQGNITFTCYVMYIYKYVCTNFIVRMCLQNYYGIKYIWKTISNRRFNNATRTVLSNP